MMTDISDQATTESNNRMTLKKEVVIVEDLILEILLHVPPISILRFKSVCKRWYSLISNPFFLRKHARQFHSKRRLDPRVRVPGLLLSPDFGFPDFKNNPSFYRKHSVYAMLPQAHQDLDKDEHEIPPPPSLKVFLDHSLPAFKQKNPGCSFVVDSCNGLLLYYCPDECYADDRYCSDSTEPYQYQIFNPITSQCMEIPLMNLLQTFIKPNEVIVDVYPHIVFDPSISLSYKVLTILFDPSYTDSHIYVYSSDIGSWRFLTSFTTNYGIVLKTLMFDGVFYWLRNDALVCFDLVKESVFILPLPPLPAGNPFREVLYFGECGGHLRLIEEYSEGRNPGSWFPYSFDIMEKELSSAVWTVKFRVNIQTGFDHLIQEKEHPDNHGIVKVMYLYETEKGETAVLLNVDFERIVSFNITTNTFGKELSIPYYEHYHSVNAFEFTPTSFPLTNMMNADKFVTDQ